MNNDLTVRMLVIGRLHELMALHRAFKGPVFFEMGQALLADADSQGIDGIPTNLFTYFEIVP
ncbi:MAG: hypothetical protein ACRC6V_05655 [Bacteroidales bacterium]